MRIKYTDDALYHYNMHHVPAGRPGAGRFDFGDGDGDGQRNDHAHRSDNQNTISREQHQSSSSSNSGYRTVSDLPPAWREKIEEIAEEAGQPIDDNTPMPSTKDLRKFSNSQLRDMRDLAKSSQAVGRQISSTADMFKYKKSRGRIDVSHMSDEELRAILNREQMERQYNQYFNEPQVNKGAQFAKGAGDVITFLGTTGLTALQIVQAINELRG